MTPDDTPESESISEPEPTSNEIAPPEIVEAHPVRPAPRKLPVALILMVVLFVTVAAGLFAYDASVVAAEREAFVQAKDQASHAGWLAYITWAENPGAWTESRAPLERHLVYAHERLELQRAYAAANAHDEDALCAILAEHQDNSPSQLAALRSLRLWLGQSAAQYESRARAFHVPPLMRLVMAATFTARQQQDPCSGTATVRVIAETSNTRGLVSATEHTGAIVSAYLTSERLEATVVRATEHLASIVPNAVPFEIVSRDDAADPNSLAELTVAYRFFLENEFALPRGASIHGLGVEVRVTGTAPGIESSDVTPLLYHLDDAFGVQVYQAAESGAEEAVLIGSMIEALLSAAKIRLPQSVGLMRYTTSNDGGGGALICRTMASLTPGVMASGNTREGTDRRQGSCEEPEMYDELEDLYDDESIGHPEQGHKLVVPTRSQVSVWATAEDFPPLVFVRNGCEYGSAETACNAEGIVRIVAEEGLYVAWVSSELAEEAGPYSIVSAIRPLANIEAACADDQSTLLVSGQAREGQLGVGDDLFDGACGGIGSTEQHYRLVLSEPSRVRCVADSSAEVVVHARTSCNSFESELGCADNAPLEIEAPAGTLHIFVDGYMDRGEGEFELTCTVFSPNMEVAGDSCETAIPLEVGHDNTVTVPFDLAPAHPSESMTCRSGSDLAYTFELAERSYVTATSSRASAVTFLSSTCSTAQGGCRPHGALLDAGRAYLRVGTAALGFPAGTVTVEVVPFSRVCENLPLLRSGRIAVPRSQRDLFTLSCGAEILNDVAYRLRLLHPARVQIESDPSAILGIVRGCVDGQEIACTASSATHHIDEVLPAGEYTVVVGRSSYYLYIEVSITRTDGDSTENVE